MTLVAAIWLMLAPAPSRVPVACIKDRHGQTVVFRAANAATCARLRGIALETVP